MHTWKKTSRALLLFLHLLPLLRRIVYLKSSGDAGIIYPISDSPWVSPTQVVPKKSGIMVVQNDKGEEVSTRLTSGWRKLMLKTEKTTFTCPFEPMHTEECLSAYAMHATFQRCMLSIFSDMVERIMEVFMDDITIYGRIVLGHIISKQGIEVDKAKVELIVKLPSPTTVKGVRQFLGHAGFYRRFIKDFSKLARPLCELLELSWAKRRWKALYAKARLIRWIPLLQEFNLQIKDKKGVENVVADHLSRLAIAHNSHSLPINDDFPEESLMLIESLLGNPQSLHHESACGGHFASQKIAMKVLQSGFCWPSLFKDAHTMCRSCDNAKAWKVNMQEHDAFEPHFNS
ncbi:putative mitochondrial protein [Vitis vinifera]|uniref:Putative mitochondrial protein n=1 Tax=Vitis vinifera TaxID=29760 RepID=A0A438CJM5_VITVI|nr:putative mitochondrial protein [Vitis vinifera]